MEQTKEAQAATKFAIYRKCAALDVEIDLVFVCDCDGRRDGKEIVREGRNGTDKQGSYTIGEMGTVDTEVTLHDERVRRVDGERRGTVASPSDGVGDEERAPTTDTEDAETDVLS